MREAVGADFPGGTYRQVFYMWRTSRRCPGPAIDGDLHIDLDEADFLAVFPLKGKGRARLIGTVRDERAEHPDTLKFEDVSSRAIEHLKVQVAKVNWFSTYRVHHRGERPVPQRPRLPRWATRGPHPQARPGGQGMNTGIGDAINLAWKLAAVLSGRALTPCSTATPKSASAFARRLVATTDKAPLQPGDSREGVVGGRQSGHGSCRS